MRRRIPTPRRRVPVVDPTDLDAVARQLGREPRGVLAIAYRCPNGEPGVVRTAPRLPDGTPFPTLYYLTHPALTAAASRLESAGLMREMTERLSGDPDLAAAYRRAHEDYLASATRSNRWAPPSPAAGCLIGSSACTSSWPIRWQKAPASTHSATRHWPSWPRNREWPASWTRRMDRSRRMTDRVAAIDCGTNSIRLLIADIDRAWPPTAPMRVRDVQREMRIVRLGQGVDATGKFAPEAIARTRDALADYADLLRQFGVDRVRWSRRRQPATRRTATSSST
jgi:hypothetical protein